MHELLCKIAAEYSTPCFVYDVDHVRQRAAELRRAFGGRFQLSYAVKCNPNPMLLRRMRGIVDLLDISSGGELRTTIDAGWPPALLSFTGPGKRDSELRRAIEQRIGYVIVESVREAETLDRFARQSGIIQPILVRIAPAKVPPGFGSRMAGKPSQFGIDEEDLDAAIPVIRDMRGLDLCGFHVYSGTQCLNPDAIAQNYEICIDLFRRACETHGLAPLALIFGSGLGIPYHEQDQPLDLEEIADRVVPALQKLAGERPFAETQVILELGRYLVGEAGLYLTRVISSKRSRGQEIRVCDGGMNHHLGACGHLGSIIPRNYRMFKVGDTTATSLQTYDLFGPLCTSIDMLGHGAVLPPLEVGDVIAIQCSGAYGLTASPIHFISHEPPCEVLVETIQNVIKTENVSTLRGSDVVRDRASQGSREA
jgi:diaminopimelate decarboxylase